MNFVLRRHRDPENDYEPLLKLAEEKDVGRIAIASMAKGPWKDEPHSYRTWYEPFDEQKSIDQCLRFALSQNITTAVAPGDIRLLSKALEVGQRFAPMGGAEQGLLIRSAGALKPLWPA